MEDRGEVLTNESLRQRGKKLVPQQSKTRSSRTGRVSVTGEIPGGRLELYSPLRSKRNEIRLLRLFPASCHSSRLEGSLETVRLHSCPPYVALSYEWGENPSTTEHLLHLQIGSHEKPLWPNLADALLTLRMSLTEPLVVWIDALCINQADTKERNAQVQMMKRIYQSSSAVWV